MTNNTTAEVSEREEELKPLRAAMQEALEALADSRRYLTEFGSVEPSALVRRINFAITNLKRQRDEVFYRDQWRTINAARAERGEQSLSYSMFLAGGGE